jgi:hypothetical protein
MPDRRKHRGRHPEDQAGFAQERLPALRSAVGELSWLLSRGYAVDSALKLVGDRYALTTRQRRAVQRSACTDESLRSRGERRVEPKAIRGQPLGVDGYNLLITIESALAGGVILVGRDGCLRDLASVHGTYRHVEETVPAVRLILDFVACMAPARVDWYLDKPVANSGRLKARMAEALEGQRAATPWNIELVDSPDSVLSCYAGVVATSDSVILDRCGQWVNLAAVIVERSVPRAWIVDLRDKARAVSTFLRPNGPE